METFILVGYLISLLIFFVMSTLIIRHTIKYAYLSPRFKNIVFVFGLIALCIIVFSLVLLFNLFAISSGDSTPAATRSIDSSSGINF